MNEPRVRSTKPAGAALLPLPLALLQSMRPKQWSKNGLLFMALIFSHSLMDPSLTIRATVGFLGFCLLSSGTYIVNDLVDIERDRLHPAKRKRPIASGELPPTVASIAALLALVASLGLALALGTSFALVAGLYLLLSLSYSTVVKQLVILDVLTVAMLFVLRAAAGAVAIEVPVSPWLYVVTALGALFLVFSKRRHELVLLQSSASSHRPILEEYSLPLLDQMIAVVTSASVIAYSLYTFSAENLPRNNAMMLTIPFLLYGIFRYLYLIHVKGAGGSPEDLLISDRPLLATVIGWLAVSTAIIYLSG